VRKRLRSRIGAALAGATLVTVGLVVPAGVSQAAGHLEVARAAGQSKVVPPYYLSLGDSWSVGYQPVAGGGATAGFTSYVAKKVHMQLENFGCAGATTSSVLFTLGCTDPFGPPANIDAVAYPTTSQEQAAVNFIDSNPGKVGLITISIGGNDVASCAGASNAVACITAVTAEISTNVTTLVDDLRCALAAAHDTDAKIIGLTYIDVDLGLYVNPGGSANQSLAALTVLAFTDFVNPALESIYTAAPGGSFVNETTAPYKKATLGSTTPFSITEKLSPYGVIPAAVAEVCHLTFQCSLSNGHPTDKGYAFIGRLVVSDFESA